VVIILDQLPQEHRDKEIQVVLEELMDPAAAAVLLVVALQEVLH
jgi:hypothetical protein